MQGDFNASVNDDRANMSDDRVKEGVNFFSDQLRKLGLIGDGTANVGADREATPDPTQALTGGTAPMMRMNTQLDR
jgi:hypothetical protein